MAVSARPPIVTARFGYDDSFTLERYVATGGYEGLRRALARTPEDVAREVKDANIQGRGGAGFPAGNKWGLLVPTYPRWLVVNGDESEPGTYKDRLLMERDPHLLIEGALICAYAIRASQAFLYVRGEMALAQERIASALNEGYANGFVGRNVLDSTWSMDITLHWGAGAYIVGEETALIESLEGQRGQPRLKPPDFPAVRGLYGDPTIVNNVETLCNLPWIMINGAAGYGEIGDDTARGMRMFALSGHVKRPGVYEVEQGTTTFRDLLYAPEYGGGIREDRRLKAFIPGGASAPWWYEEHLDMPLSDPVAKRNGSMLGSGAVVVMDETTDAVKAAWRLVRFFARESCGKCTPCREGTPWLEKIYQRILSGQGRPDDVELLLDVTDNISPGLAWPPRQTTICLLGPSAASPVLSSIRRFRDEYDAYISRAEQIRATGGAEGDRISVQIGTRA